MDVLLQLISTKHSRIWHEWR